MKEKIFNTAKFLIGATAIIQLAMSQIHIGIITKVFLPEVGFFLFLFVIFGIVTAFNSSNVKGIKAIIFSVGCLLACFLGGLYVTVLFKDIQMDNVLTFSQARESIIIILVSIFIYFFSGLAIMLTRNHDE